MQPVIHTSKFVHHMQVLSPDFSRYVSHSFTIPSHAQQQEHQHGTYAAGLPGICDVNLVSHTMGDDISVGHPHNQLFATPGGPSPGPTAHGAEASQAPSEPSRTHLRLTVTASDDASDTFCRPGRAQAAARTTHGLAPPPPRASLQQANRRQAK